MCAVHLFRNQLQPVQFLCPSADELPCLLRSMPLSASSGTQPLSTHPLSAAATALAATALAATAIAAATVLVAAAAPPCCEHCQRNHILFRVWLELDRATVFAAGILCLPVQPVHDHGSL